MQMHSYRIIFALQGDEMGKGGREGEGEGDRKYMSNEDFDKLPAAGDKAI